MNAAEMHAWPEANQRYLVAALGEVRRALERHAGGAATDAAPDAPGADAPGADAATMSAPPALAVLCAAFGLTRFERAVLLLCAGPELDAGFAGLCAQAQGDERRTSPTFGLALAALPDAHWSALLPTAPLRRWRLLEPVGAEPLTSSPLRIDERILHYLTGLSYLDDRLAGIVEPVEGASTLTASQLAQVGRMAALWSPRSGSARPPLIQLCGGDAFTRRAAAAEVCTKLGLHLFAVSTPVLPATPGELDGLLRLWQRETLLTGCALLVEHDAGETQDAARAALLTRFVERVGGAVMLSGRDPVRGVTRPVVSFDIAKPSIAEQRRLWQQTLGTETAALDGHVEALVSNFNLEAQAIVLAGTAALTAAATAADDAERRSGPRLAQALWEACRRQTRPRLEDLAQRIEPAANWDDLVIPPLQQQMLREIAAGVRQRAKVYETWGFAAKGARGLGLSALFAGPSGTGKTMAAEVLANELRFDLYRIDLSQVVSKYIGETEKNLRRIFDAAEDGGAILLFDEADAIFGKRTEIKDSHDRYANIEVSYLLQRMEAYRGLAILTTNMKQAMDAAFMRRLRFVVTFPFPDTRQRAEIWRNVFPARTPTAGLDLERLARLSVAGGNIRNIALNAAFLAADADEPVGMPHIMRAARSEYAKLEKLLTEAEAGGSV